MGEPDRTAGERPAHYIHGTDAVEQERLSLLNGLMNAASLRALRLAPGDRVVDFGSGLGQLSRAMARQVGPEGRVVAIEREAAQIAEAERLAAVAGEEGLVEFRRGRVEAPPLADDEWGGFDVAHARFLLEHVPDPVAVVSAMVRAVRPGGRLVIEDDDHDLLRLSPPEPRVMALWRAYARTYEHLGNDPHVGRRLVSLLHAAGAEPRRNDMLFFGGCAGCSTFEAMAVNFAGVLAGARGTLLAHGEVTEAEVDAALAAFRDWTRRPDAALWYVTCWAEAVRPGGGDGSAATAVSTAEPVPPATHRADELLRFLADSARDLGSTLRLDEVFAKIAQRVQSLLDAHLFCVMLWNEAAGLLEHSYSLKFGRHVEQSGGFPLGYGISGHAAETLSPVRVANVQDDPRYVRFRHAEVEIRSELAVPLICDGRLIGVLDLESTEFDAFTFEHEQVLSALAAHVASALENARLYEETRRSQRRLAGELATAREIQRALLPRRAPVVAGIEIGTAHAPALELSGDFFDLLPYGEGRVAFALGDVAGKGTPAALLASVTVGALRAQALELRGQPRQMLRQLNEQLRRLRIEHRFVAMAFGICDGGADGPRHLRLANAGVPLPLKVTADGVEELDLPGLPLGALDDHEYGQLDLMLESGESMVLVSDGVEDVEDADGESFGPARVRQVLTEAHGRPAQEVADALIAATDRHAGHGRPGDDRTVVVLRAEGLAQSPTGDGPQTLQT